MEQLHLSRRDFLRLAALGTGSLALAGCSENLADTPEPPTFTPETTDDTPEVPASAENYALHENITATVFWIGEAADASNDFISNVPTAWDSDAAQRFGGYDGATGPDTSVTDVPRDENGIVTEFIPKHNPFYFALPAGEFDENGRIPGARERSPWASQVVPEGESLFKGRWIMVTNGQATIYAQWLDVGPNEEQDYDYVFGDGTQSPENTFGLNAGLDLSPAAATGLGFNDGGITVSWSFIDAKDVPNGPWKDYPPIDNKTYWS